MRLSALVPRRLASRLARNSASNFVGQLARVTLQGAYFVIIARVLGVDGFGAFSAVVALAAVLSPFASLGAMNLLLKNSVLDHGSRKRNFATALLVTAVAGTAAVIAILAISALALPSSIALSAVLLVSLGDILGVRLAEVCLSLFAAEERMLPVAVFQLSLYGARLLAAAVLWGIWGSFDLIDWAVAYCVTTGVVVAILASLTIIKYGVAKPDLQHYRRQYKQGLQFSIGLASQSVYNDIDKAMLAQFSTLAAVGTYTAAYRVIDMMFTPVRAVLSAAYPRFFRHGQNGISPALRFARRILTPSCIYCALMAIVLLATAELLPLLLGEEYESAVAVLRALCALPLIKAVHYAAADTLTGAGLQGRRSFTQVGVALLNIALNVPAISLFGYWGAVWTSYISDGLLAILLWSLVALEVRRQRASSANADKSMDSTHVDEVSRG